jgi:signal transduction histidine kinase
MGRGGEIAGRGRKASERIPYPVGKAADQAGALLHVSGRYVSAAKKLVTEAPEAAELVREGRVTLPDAKRLIDVPTARRRATVAKIRNGEAKTLRAALPVPQGEWQRARAAADLHALLDRVHRRWPPREWRVFADELRQHAVRIEKQVGADDAGTTLLEGSGRTDPGSIPVLEEVTERSREPATDAPRAREDVERLKDDLTNMVVHDLKDPVNGIAMLVQLTLRKGVSTTQRNSLLQIERSCGEMLRLIDNLLEISKLEDGKMPVRAEPLVLGDIVDEVAAEYGPVAAETGRRLTAAIGPKLPRIVADRGLLKRVLVNLVVNALRHSDSKDVRVEATHDPATARVSLQVIDRGRGIAEADQARLFEKFARGRRSGDSEWGSDRAFGLPFCKLATEAMGGEIVVSGRPEAGTVCKITLPSEPAK